MKETRPLVSVIIPAYNTEPYIGEMLDCVVNQTYSSLQIIVIDDASSDNTAAIVEKYAAEDVRVQLIRVKNRGGVSRARNIGFGHAKGEFLCFWDSDDFIEAEYIDETIKFINANCVEAVLVGWANYEDGERQQPADHELKTIYRGDMIVAELIPRFIGHSCQDINDWIQNKKGLREGK